MKKFLGILFCFVVLVSGCNKEEDKTSSKEMQSSKFKTLVKFNSVDLTGVPVDESIFKNADVTLVNIWATWCGPCMRELPELGEIAKKYEPEGYQVIGLIHDVSTNDMENAEYALEILADAGCEYTVIANSDSLGPIFNDVVAYPTTFFVDQKGAIIGVEYTGAMTGPEFEKAFQNAIDTQAGKN